MDRGATLPSRGPSPPDQVPALGEQVRALVAVLMAARSPDLYREVMRAVERPLLGHVLRLQRGNQLRAARVLGLKS